MEILTINIWTDNDGVSFMAAVGSFKNQVVGCAAGDTPEQALADAWRNYFDMLK
jgi:hypothetical protein